MIWKGKAARGIRGVQAIADNRLSCPWPTAVHVGNEGNSEKSPAAFPPGGFSARERQRLLWLREHLLDFGEKREELSIVGRLYFARWLVSHGRIGAFS